MCKVNYHLALVYWHSRALGHVYDCLGEVLCYPLRPLQRGIVAKLLYVNKLYLI